MNYEMINAVRDRIAAVGNEHCNMHRWISSPKRGALNVQISGSGEPPCGTTACIAGHLLAIKNGTFTWHESLSDEYIPEKAAEILGINNPGLFFMHCWPKHYKDLAESEGHAKGMIAILDAIVDGTVDPEKLYEY